MQALSVPVLPSAPRIRPRTALVASADRAFRRRIHEILAGLRWQVREAEGGAAAWTEATAAIPEAVIIDSWLPDLDHEEFLKDFRQYFPEVDILSADGTVAQDGPRGPHRQELLYALHRSQEGYPAAAHPVPKLTVVRAMPKPRADRTSQETLPADRVCATKTRTNDVGLSTTKISVEEQRLPELVGEGPCMLEVSRRVRLVAPRSTPVLIEGPTGSGKELVAQALHRLSPRSCKPFVAINCAAIPEALLEAELFGHTRGAFTGAVQGRVGRIEAADGGTLFLDEIGEMPLALQAKLLRFVESGELQRVGDNQTVKVDVRIVAATHRALVQQAQTGSFRADLYYRLAVFLIQTPALQEHIEDLPLLVEHFLKRMGRETPVKRLDEGAQAKLAAHTWPGNVRELEHVLERAAILAGDLPVLTAREIEFGVPMSC